MRRTVVLMLKEPRPGRVKTRLGRDIGMGAAAWWFRHQAQGLIRRLHDPRWTLILSVSPDIQAQTSRVWPAAVPRMPQGRGTIGDRMLRALGAGSPGPVCVIGADIPGLSKPHLARAFGALGRAEVVFGPASDGGFWLVGVRGGRRLPRATFRDVRWSTPTALHDAIATLRDRDVALVDCLDDVDTAEDLNRHRLTGRGRRFSQ